MKEAVDLALKYHMQSRETEEAREGIAMFNEQQPSEVDRIAAEWQPAF